MAYQALYRKWRPSNFDEVRGQDHIVTTLKNQIEMNRIGHAYLFCGTRGTGKTSIAKIFAKAVNCEHPVNGSPCNECAMCRAVNEQRSMNVIEIDAASNNGVDNIREIREEVAYSPSEGKYKVYIIDEVHMLSIGAFNALLKTLEEPPSYVIFILATTEAHKIPITILSRCQRYDFRRISTGTIAGRLRELADAEGIDAEDAALAYVARMADGSMRDALSLLDQCNAFYIGQKLKYENVLDVLGAVDTSVFGSLLKSICSQDVSGVIHLIDEIVMQGRDLTQFVNDFTWYLRNLMLLKASDDMEDILDISTENLAQLREEAAMIRNDTLMRFIRIFSELANSIRYSVNKRVMLEMALIKLCKPEAEKDDLSLIERIRKLERMIEQGIAVPGRMPAPSGASASSADDGRWDPAMYGANGDSRYAASGVGVPAGGAGYNSTAGNPDPSLPTAKAAPEDLKKVKAMWKNIIVETSAPFRLALASAEVKYNAQEENDNRLFVVFADFLAERYINNADRKRELESIIADKTGKQVEVRFMLAADEGAHRGKLASIDIDERIREFIHADIEIEDEN